MAISRNILRAWRNEAFWIFISAGERRLVYLQVAILSPFFLYAPFPFLRVLRNEAPMRWHKTAPYWMEWKCFPLKLKIGSCCGAVFMRAWVHTLLSGLLVIVERQVKVVERARQLVVGWRTHRRGQLTAPFSRLEPCQYPPQRTGS